MVGSWSQVGSGQVRVMWGLLTGLHVELSERYHMGVVSYSTRNALKPNDQKGFSTR